VFKHVLVRDALYQTLLTGPRAALHFKIAEEIERRAGNRLPEVVEALANHFGRTDRADKAFTYLAMAGAKSLGVYSLDHAAEYLEAALAVLYKNPDCATDDQVVNFIADYSLLSNASFRLTSTTDCVEHFAPRLNRLISSHKRIVIQHHYALALLWSGRYFEAENAQATLSSMASRLGDLRSRAYELASRIHISTYVMPFSTENFKSLSEEAVMAGSEVNDGYLQIMIRYFVGWEEFHRGHLLKAAEWAEELVTTVV
jgi:hypothetical protein